MVIGAAVVLRTLFPAEVSNEIDLVHIDRAAGYVNYLRQTQPSFLEAFSQARSQMGGLSDLILYAPNLLVYYLFGITRWTSIIPSLLISLVNIGLIYSLGRIFTRSVVAALLTALFWAFFPLDVFYSTAAPRVEALTFLTLLGIWLFLFAREKSAIGRYAAFLFVGMLLFFLEPWALVAPALFLAFLFFSMRPNGKWILFVLTAGIGIFLLARWTVLGVAFLDFYTLVLDQPESVFILPLFLVAFTVDLLKSNRRGHLHLSFAAAVLVAFIFRRLFSDPSSPTSIYTAGIYILPFFVSVAMTVGDYFSKDLIERNGAFWTFTLALLGTLGAVAAVVGSRDFLPSLANFDWIGLHSLFLIYSILAGVAFAGILLSPYFFASPSENWNIKARYVLLAIILLATLPHSRAKSNEHRYLMEAPAKALTYINEQELSLPIYTVNAGAYRSTNMLIKMDGVREALAEKGISLISISGEQANQVQEGYILSFENELDSPQGNWLRMGSFGPLGKPRVVVYRVLPASEAEQFSIPTEEETLSSSQASSWDEYGYLINRGLLCDAYTAWSGDTWTSDVRVIPYNSQSDCLITHTNLVELSDLKQSSNIQGYITFTNPPQPAFGEPEQIDMIQVTLPIYDMRTSSVNVPLQPNTLYLYLVEVKSPSPTITLYWNVADQEDYSEMKTYAEWSTVAMLILTPDWDTPNAVSFSPVLFDHIDVVSVRNFFIGSVEIMEDQ